MIFENFDRKIYNDVFDFSTTYVLYKLENSGYIDRIKSIISTGKEANVFLGYNFQKEPIAIKIYRIETSNFNNMYKYIAGDHRFEYVKLRKRDIVFAWAKKEFKNLEIAYKVGVRVPRPIVWRKNVLVMEFIGENETPAPRAKDQPPNDPNAWFEKIMEYVEKLYKKGKLVHGDISEYNILNFNEEPVLIDIGQGVPKDHPLALELLKRDLENIHRWFKKFGIKFDVNQKFKELVN